MEALRCVSFSPPVRVLMANGLNLRFSLSILYQRSPEHKGISFFVRWGEGEIVKNFQAFGGSVLHTRIQEGAVAQRRRLCSPCRRFQVQSPTFPIKMEQAECGAKDLSPGQLRATMRPLQRFQVLVPPPPHMTQIQTEYL